MIVRRAMLASVLLGAAAPAPVLPPAALPASRMDTPWWRARHEAKLADKAARPIDMIWLGDSITQNFETAGPEQWRAFLPVWQRYYAPRNALNLGFKGDATNHLLWRLRHGEVDGISPKVAIILIGANNMGRLHYSAPDSIRGIEEVVTEVRRRLPHTAILLLSVLPSIRNAYVDQTTAQTNQALAAAYGSGRVPGVTWLDVTRLFLHDGRVDRTRFLDDQLRPPDPPLHPTAQTQALLAATIEPTLAALMGDKPR